MLHRGVIILQSKYFFQGVFQKCKIMSHRMFHKYLFFTNVGISASLSFAGDVILQNYEILQDKERKFDKARTYRMTVAGVTVGAVCHFWYKYLDERFPGRTLKTVLKKVAFDQFLITPCYIAVFFATTCALECTSLKDFEYELFHKGWRLYLAEWIIWPPAQIINFYLIPPRFRILYDNIISLGCDIYTSYVKNDLEDSDSEPETSESEKKKDR